MSNPKRYPLQILDIQGKTIPIYQCHTLILGSGAASLASAVRLKRAGISDLLMVTDNIQGGTSRNTGSDKQTYYKLSDATSSPDSPYDMAGLLYKGGATHGDIALTEALGSENGFYHLVGMGVPFPYNRWGGYTGYKTDHDAKKRGISLGPYTSKVMVEYLENECHLLDINIWDRHDCIKLIPMEDRIIGAIVMDKRNLQHSWGLKIILCENMIFGLGGPGGLYEQSVYPSAHTGGIGLALEIGAEAVNLTESQFGIGSIQFRWNLSGSYQQVIPHYFSVDPKTGKTYNFLADFFSSMEELTYATFLKGYQWPFNPNNLEHNGSSLIDLLVYQEQILFHRKVYIDFRENPKGNPSIGAWNKTALKEEILHYWKNSSITADTPIQRLSQLNPEAIALYKTHNIDLYKEPLKVAICAQHNNGGLAGDIWWESTNFKHFFPVGEVNGSHGVYRPGGTALNSGQVGAFRAAQKIAGAYKDQSLSIKEAITCAIKESNAIIELCSKLTQGNPIPECDKRYREAFQKRMSQYGGPIRSREHLNNVLEEAQKQVEAFTQLQISEEQLPRVLKLRHLVFAGKAYLHAIDNYIEQGGGSRGSYLIIDSQGMFIDKRLPSLWKTKPEQVNLKEYLQTMQWNPKEKKFIISWIPRRDIPQDSSWFETIWAEFTQKKVYQ